jgi:uncharacterized protein YjiK
MKPASLLMASVVTVVFALACRSSEGSRSLRGDSAELKARDAKLAQRMASTPGGIETGKPVARWILPRALTEISGIAMTSDGRLLTHDDEHGQITVIDPKRGAVLKRFVLGEAGTRGDFEGITVANGTIYVVVSNGNLLEFAEGANGQRMPYTVHETRLGRECEFEGVTYDASVKSLILACKNVGMKQYKDRVVLYRWSLERNTSRVTMLTIPLRAAIGENDWDGFHPSDITVDPRTGNYVLVASKEKGLLEITSSGSVVRSIPLPDEGHSQPEGVAITSDGILIVSDEGTRSAPTITLYRWPATSATNHASP